MRVAWNKDQEGFQDCWIWQYGEGPFDVVKEYQAPTEPRFLGNIPITYEPGKQSYISISDDSYFKVEHRVEHVLFHEKWFSEQVEE